MSALGATFLCFSSFLGNSFICVGHPFGLERVFHCKGSEKGLDIGSVVHSLGSLENLECHYF